MDKRWILPIVLIVLFLSFSSAGAYEAINGPTQLIQYNASKAYEGYTLMTPMRSDKSYLIDMFGYVVHTWEHKTKLSGQHFILLENGHILGNTAPVEGPGKLNYGGSTGGLIELDWDGNVVWEWNPGPSDGTLHHDFVRLPNGNTLCNIWEAISYEDAVAGGRRVDQTTEKGVVTDVIYEIDPDGNVVWKWNAWEHRGMNSKFNLDANYITYVLPEHAHDNPDWTHFNDVDYDPATDRILTDSREFGEIYILDHKTGDILYRWGNPSAYGAGAPSTFTTPGEQILFGPHDSHWIKEGLPGAGNILIFNNGWGRSPINYSSIIEMNPDTGEIVWEYKSNSENAFFSHHIAGSQRLPNGNTLICSGNNGHLFEVTAEKEVVWEFISPIIGKETTNWMKDAGMRDGNSIFRAHRYGSDYPGLKGKTLKPQGMIEDDVKGGWHPRVDTDGATQQGAKLWKKLWK